MMGGMNGDDLRSWSLRLFFLTLGSAAVAAAAFAGSMNPFGPDFAYLAVLLALIAICANAAALAFGGLAWARNGKKCPWIIVNGILAIGTIWWVGLLLTL